MTNVLTEKDFDGISWHDDEIHAMEFRVGEPEQDDWTSDLVLDLDHIVQWVPGPPRMRFSVAPATLCFHGVTDLRVELASGTEGWQVSLALPSIAAIEREPVAEQRVYLDRSYYRWVIRLNGTPEGQLVFGAYGFTQTLRGEPVLSDQPRLPRVRREAL